MSKREGYVTDALVLRVADCGENDRIYTLLSPTRGRYVTVAKGARSFRSPFSPLQPYTYANFEAVEGRGMGYLRSLSVIESFEELRSSLFGLFYAAYFADIASELGCEGEDSQDLLRLTLNAFHLLSKNVKEDMEVFRKIKSVYELRAAAISGYLPDLSVCGTCLRRTETIQNPLYLDVMNGAVLCGDCLRKRPIAYGYREDPDQDGTASILVPMTEAALLAMQYIVTAESKRIFSFSLPEEEDRKALSVATETYLLHHIERGFDSLDFLRKMTEHL